MISASSTIDLDVEKSGNFRSTDFKIKNNAKMFKILSSGLYKNKIRAILREFSTNAWDSHVINGNPKEPFLVKLPSHLDPNLTIRDYGVGLSEREIREIYTTYGESTKDQSNSVNGTFGLGAKSVFSYTDSATLHSFKDGIKTTYSLHINAHGIPECSRLVAVQTSDRNGVEIVIPIKSSDYDNVRREAELVYTFFDIKPKVVGNAGYRTNSLNSAPFMEEKGKWATYHDNSGLRLFDESRAVVVMGNCGYPVDLKACGLDTYSHWLFSSSYIVFHVGIGDVDITVSRESLEYVPQTIATIKNRVADIEKAYSKKLEDEISKQKCYYDACLYYHKQPLKLNVKYNNRAIVSYIENPLYADESKTGIYTVWQFHSGNKKPNPDSNITQFYVGGGSESRYHFFLEDCQKKTYIKVQNEMNSKGYGKIGILIKDPANLKKFIDGVGILDSQVIRTSTLPEPPKAVRNKVPKVGGYHLQLDSQQQKRSYYSYSNSDNMTYCWKRLEDLPPKSVVVGFDQYYALASDGSKMRPQDFRNSIINLPKAFNIDPKAIYGLSKEKFKKATGKGFVDFWTNFDKILDAELKKNQITYGELIEYDTMMTNGKYPGISHFFDNLANNKLCPLTPPKDLGKIKQVQSDVLKLKNDPDTARFLELIKTYRKDAIKPTTILEPLIAVIYKKAPLLYHCNWEKNYYSKNHPDPVEGISEYLKLVL